MVSERTPPLTNEKFLAGTVTLVVELAKRLYWFYQRATSAFMMLTMYVAEALTVPLAMIWNLRSSALLRTLLVFKILMDTSA